MVKKKNVYYYKCNSVGCGNNKSANQLHETFAKVLDSIKMDECPELVKLMKIHTIATFNQLIEGHNEDEQVLLKQLEETEKKLTT